MSVIFKNPATEAKIQLFFLFAPKDPFGELFSKIIFKSSREFLFWQKIRTFEIGQNIPILHNFYRAFKCIFATLVQDNEKLSWVHFFHKLFFIPWNSFPTIFHLQLNFLWFVTTRVKYSIFCIRFVRWILPYFRRP